MGGPFRFCLKDLNVRKRIAGTHFKSELFQSSMNETGDRSSGTPQQFGDFLQRASLKMKQFDRFTLQFRQGLKRGRQLLQLFFRSARSDSDECLSASHDSARLADP